MIIPRIHLPSWLAGLLMSLLLLSGCAPPAAGPSLALKEQLAQLSQAQQQQAEQLQALQQQLAQLQQLAGESVITSQIESSLSGSPPPGAVRIPASAQRELTALTESATSYLAAFSELASGRHSAAERGFERFLSDFPGHQYAANARFWLANAQESQGKLQSALNHYRQLVISPQAQAKAPAALVRMAQIYQRQNQGVQAEEVLEQLRSRFPDSPEAQHSYRSDEVQ